MSMKQIINSIIPDVPTQNESYVGDDGLLRCVVCHEKVERIVEIPELNIHRKVGCICACERKKRDAFEEQGKRAECERKRSVCFRESNMWKWTFANDDRKNPKISDAMKNYVKNFTDFRKDGKGLLLYGTVGTGKTYLAACIANALIDEGRSVLMTNFTTIVNTLHGMKEGRQTYINSLNRYDLLILDDLGVERGTEYMVEHIYNIIDARYRSGLPFIVTTNLTADELKKPQSVEYSRIYDRILERCHPVKVEGISRRRENLKDNFADTQRLLGL